MKHKTLRCTAETAALLLTVAMLAFLIAIAEKIRQQIIPDENHREQPDKLE